MYQRCSLVELSGEEIVQMSFEEALDAMRMDLRMGMEGARMETFDFVVALGVQCIFAMYASDKDVWLVIEVVKTLSISPISMK